MPPRAAPEYGEVQAAFVHHTVSANDYTPEESPGIVLGIARYHRDSNGWNDIGYNFLVDKYGQVFEGRAGGIDQAVIGAQAQGYNSVSTGIACIGTFTALPPAEPGLDALARLIGWKLSLHGVPTEGTVIVTSRGGASNRYPSGTPVTLERIPGHRDGDSTSCPGRRCTRSCPTCAPAPRATRARWPGSPCARRARASARARCGSRASCASRTAPRPPAPRSTSSSPSRAPPSRASPERSAGRTAAGRRACR